jgi:alginate O-acetyltransferase complex protein AlgJ
VHASGMKSARSAIEGATLALFLAALYAPFADQCIRPASVREPTNENRSTRPHPGMPRTPAELYRFPERFEAHFSDTFGLRDVLLRWNSRVKLDLLHVSPTPTLVIDDAGWIDYAGEATMEARRGILPMTRGAQKEWLDHFALCRDFCKRNEARYAFLLVPNKETIYPEHVPARYAPFGPSRLDQLVAALPPDLRSAFIDLRPAFLAARSADKPPLDHLYNVFGTHWNGRGTLLAYFTTMQALQSERSDVVALRADEIEMNVTPDSAFDTWGPRLYLPERFLHPNFYPTVVGFPRWQEVEFVHEPIARWTARNPSSHGPRIVVFHDSFGPALEPLFASTFSEVTFVHGWFDPAIVLAKRPDLVVEERVERIFVGPPMLPDISKRIMQQESPPPGQGALVLTVDATSDDGALATIGGAHVTRTRDGIAFSTDDGKAGWLLPAFTVENGERAWLHVELESPQSGTIIAYRKSEKGAWLRRDASFVPFEAGTTRRTVGLLGSSGPCELRLQTSSGVVVKRIEVRTTRS